MAVADHPQRLAPDRFQKAVGDVGVDLGPDAQGMHADGGQDGGGAVHQRGRIGGAGDQFDDGQQVDRVERMRDDDLRGARGTGLKVRRLETGCRRSDDRIG